MNKRAYEEPEIELIALETDNILYDSSDGDWTDWASFEEW